MTEGNGRPGVVGDVDARSRRVLVVEDSDDLRESLVLLLEIEGHQLSAAPDGASALALAREARPEVLLVDIGLPDIDGYELCRRLRDDPALSAARIVAVTGFTSAADTDRARAAGYDEVLPKPVSLEELQRALAG